jgi:auxin response factor
MAGIDLNDTVEEDEEEAEPGNACSQQSRTSSAATFPPPPPNQPRPSAAVCLELWHACAGPVAPLPRKGSVVVYLPQGHIEHLGDAAAAGGGAPPPVALPPHVFCRVVDVTLHVRAPVPTQCVRVWIARAGVQLPLTLSLLRSLQADASTDEVYAQLALVAENEVRASHNAPPALDSAWFSPCVHRDEIWADLVFLVALASCRMSRGGCADGRRTAAPRTATKGKP